MVDYGTGSGVLAAAAVLLGAEHVVAIDIDFEVLIHARQNFLVSQTNRRYSSIWFLLLCDLFVCSECIFSVGVPVACLSSTIVSTQPFRLFTQQETYSMRRATRPGR